MKIKIVPKDMVIEGTSEKSLLEICLENHLPIKSICKGKPSCAECRVKIIDGENNISPPSREELNLLGNNYFLDGRRLSCQVRCFGDVTVDIKEQLDRDEVQHKKTRGYKTDKHFESKAVLDTMILGEKTDTEKKP